MSSDIVPVALISGVTFTAYFGMKGKLPTGLQTYWDKYLGSATSSGNAPGKTLGPTDAPIVTSAGAIVRCGDGSTKALTWDQIDAGLAGANPGGKYGQHDQNEAQLYQATCGGYKVPGTVGT